MLFDKLNGLLQDTELLHGILNAIIKSLKVFDDFNLSSDSSLLAWNSVHNGINTVSHKSYLFIVVKVHSMVMYLEKSGNR